MFGGFQNVREVLECCESPRIQFLRGVHRPATLVSPRNSLEMQNPGPTLCLRGQNLHFSMTPRGFTRTFKFEKRWSKRLGKF